MFIFLIVPLFCIICVFLCHHLFLKWTWNLLMCLTILVHVVHMKFTTDTDESAQVITPKNWQTVLHPVQGSNLGHWIYCPACYPGSHKLPLLKMKSVQLCWIFYLWLLHVFNFFEVDNFGESHKQRIGLYESNQQTIIWSCEMVSLWNTVFLFPFFIFR